MPQEEFQRLCLYNAESNAIMKAMEASGDKADLSKIKLFPSLVPDRGVSDETMNAAMATLDALVSRDRTTKKKPWWKFW
jgi:hypothetical protein